MLMHVVSMLHIHLSVLTVPGRLTLVSFSHLTQSVKMLGAIYPCCCASLVSMLEVCACLCNVYALCIAKYVVA